MTEAAQPPPSPASSAGGSQPPSPISARAAAEPAAPTVPPPVTVTATVSAPAPAPPPVKLSKAEKEAERRRKAEAKEEERAIRELQKKKLAEAKEAKAKEQAAERERKAAEKALREAAKAEAAAAKKAEAERKEAERKALAEERERKAREEKEEQLRRKDELEKKAKRSSLTAFWGKPVAAAKSPAKPTPSPTPSAAASAAGPEPAAKDPRLEEAANGSPRGGASPSAGGKAAFGGIYVRGGRPVRAYQKPDDFTLLAPLRLPARRSVEELDEVLTGGAEDGAWRPAKWRKRRPALKGRKRVRGEEAAAASALQPWQLARYKFLKPNEESKRPPYHGTWTKASRAVGGRKPFGRDEALDYEVESEYEWEEEGEGEELGSDDEAEDADAPGGRDGEEDDCDGFVVDDDYLSAEEGCGAAAEARGGAAGGGQARRPAKMVPRLVVNLCPSTAPASPLLASYAVEVLAPTPLVFEPAAAAASAPTEGRSTPTAGGKATSSKVPLGNPSTLALAELVHGSSEGAPALVERFAASHPQHFKKDIGLKLKEIAAKRKRTTVAGAPYDTVALWLVHDELAEGFGLDPPPPARSRSGAKPPPKPVAKPTVAAPSAAPVAVGVVAPTVLQNMMLKPAGGTASVASDPSATSPSSASPPPAAAAGGGGSILAAAR